MWVAIKDQEKTALWEKTCSKAHAAVYLQSPCSCRCFGSWTSMFSIHFKVLREGRQKKEGILIQNRKERKKKKTGFGAHHTNPIQSLVNSLSNSKWEKLTKSVCKTEAQAGHTQSTDHIKLVSARGLVCLTLHHVAAGRFFKGDI